MYRFSPEIQRQVEDLNRSDNWHALVAWLEDVAWIAASIAACHLLTWWLTPLAVLIIGARQRGLSTILHDCAHGSGAANTRLRMLIGTLLTAYPIFQQHYAYKVSHVFTHHPRLGNLESDPDLQFFVEQKVYQLSSRRRYLARVVLLPAIGTQTAAYLRYLVRNRWRVLRGDGANGTINVATLTPRKRRLDRLGFWLFWATVVALSARLGAVDDLLLFWVLPYLTSFQILGWYIELAEHTPIVREHDVDLYMTRNRRSRGLEKWLTGIHNDHHHLDHHLNPRTPFWNLPRAREARLADENYARIDASTGGLFTKGPDGQSSTLALIVEKFTAQDGAEHSREPAQGHG